MSGAVTTCPEPPDPCKKLLEQILEFIAVLQQRYWDLRNDFGNLPETKPAQPHPRYGTRSKQGERQQYGDRQKGLRNRLDEWNENGCGPPPPGAWEWAWKDAPAPDPKPAVDATKVVVATGATIGAGYVIYRIVRFIPSLFPPLWWTIPENALVP